MMTSGLKMRVADSWLYLLVLVATRLAVRLLLLWYWLRTGSCFFGLRVRECVTSHASLACPRPRQDRDAVWAFAVAKAGPLAP